MSTYRQAPVVMARGEGCLLWDTEGRRYLDMTAGIAVCALGHGDPGLADAVATQARRLIHTSNLYYVETQLELAAALARRAFPGRIFFCNSGAEANEAALKLARRYQHVVRGQPERYELVAFHNSFHGRTFGALSVTGQEKYRQGFEPLLPGVHFVPFGDLAAVTAALSSRTAAVIIEPIQAEGGVLVPPPGFLRGLRAACDAAGALLIFDEVQTGVGRTGTFYAFERAEADGPVVPDIVTLAKGIAGGVPMGVALAREEVARAFEPGSHASTFGGNPLASAAALYIQRAIDERGLLARADSLGRHLTAGLSRLAAAHPERVAGVRGRGLLQGLALHEDAAPVVGRARERGVLLSVAGGRVLRFAPPLVVSDAQLDEALAQVADTLAASAAA